MSVLKFALGALALGGFTLGQGTDTPYPMPSFSNGPGFTGTISAAVETTPFPLPGITGPDFTVGPVDPPVTINDKRQRLEHSTLSTSVYPMPSITKPDFEVPTIPANDKREALFTLPHHPHRSASPSGTPSPVANDKRQLIWDPFYHPHNRPSRSIPTATILTRVIANNVPNRDDPTITAAPSTTTTVSSACPSDYHLTTVTNPSVQCTSSVAPKTCTTIVYTVTACEPDMTSNSTSWTRRSERWVTAHTARIPYSGDFSDTGRFSLADRRHPGGKVRKTEVAVVTSTDLGGRSQRYVAREARATRKA
ncbi:hypothetical protein NX059_001388 [Plenodomus lindquistii]|nr:hypothetical protein NX059_001388 [Plenodomus lindquistii]